MVNLLPRLNLFEPLSNLIRMLLDRVLVPRSDLTTINFLCACETYDCGTQIVARFY